MIPFTLGGILLKVDPHLTGQLNSPPESAGMAEYCQCPDCQARKLFARWFLSDEVRSLLTPLIIDPRRVTIRLPAKRLKSDPAGLSRELWIYPICGDKAEFVRSERQKAGDHDFAWLTKKPNQRIKLQRWQMPAYNRQKHGVCAWLNVSRLVPDMKSVAPRIVQESFRQPCPNCQWRWRLTFFLKKKGPLFDRVLKSIGLDRKALKGYRLRASYCENCGKNLSCIVQNRPPFFDSSVERGPRKKWMIEEENG